MRQMKSNFAILTILILVRLKNYLRLAGIVASRIAIFRLGLFVFEAARFWLGRNGLLKRPRRAAVGLDSPRSTLLIIARETPERSATWASDQPRASRSALIRAAIIDVGSDRIVDITPVSWIFWLGASEKRDRTK